MKGKLTRSETDRMIAGVCGGIAQAYEIDITLVRVVFVALVPFGAVGLWVYVALWLLVPPASRADADPRDVVREGLAEGRKFAEDTARAARDALQRDRGAA